jgi:hypothetical protein
MPGGTELELGRWLLASGRYEDAISELQSLMQKHAASTAADGRELLHRAQLMTASQLAKLERPGNDHAAAMTPLVALGREPLDFSIVASRIARASLLWVEWRWRRRGRSSSVGIPMETTCFSAASSNRNSWRW